MRNSERISHSVKTSAPSKKLLGAKRKTAKRPTDFKSLSWYLTAALSVAIPNDRRDERNRH